MAQDKGEPVLFEGKFSQANLWKEKDPSDPTAQITSKSGMFKWFRDWGFAPTDAGDDPKKYVRAMAYLIQDQSAVGLKLDPEKSSGGKLVAKPLGIKAQVSMEEAEKFASQILGIGKKK